MRHLLLLLACSGLLLSSGAVHAQDEAVQQDEQVAPVPPEMQMRGADETPEPYAVEEDAAEVKEDVVEAADIAHHDGHAVEGKGGLPQFDPTWFPSQIFWLVVTFAVLFTVMSTTVLPALGGTIAARRSRIEADLLAAEDLSTQARMLSETVGRQLQGAHAEAVSILAHAGHDVSEEVAAKQHAFQDRAHAQMDKLTKDIDKATVKAKADMEGDIAALVGDVLNKAAGLKMTDKEVKTLLAKNDAKSEAA